MRVAAPVDGKKIDELYALNANGIGGYYPIGSNNAWHGGVHFDGKAAIKAVADGQIIGYRLCKKHCTLSVNGKSYSYSNCFVLIEHHYESPNGQKLTFYSHYNHLLPSDNYDASQKTMARALSAPVYDTIVTNPISVKAGDCIGFAGLFESEGVSTGHYTTHLEIFSADDIVSFIANPKKDGSDKPDTLKVEAGAVLKKAEKKYSDTAALKSGKIKAVTSATMLNNSDKTYINIRETAITRSVARECLEYHDNAGTANDYYTVKSDKLASVSALFDSIEIDISTKFTLVKKDGNNRHVKFTVPAEDANTWWVKRSSVGNPQESDFEIKNDCAETYTANPDTVVFENDAGTVAADFFVEMKACANVQSNGATWYHVKCDVLDGWIKSTDQKLKKLSAFDWPGFTIVEESGDTQYDPVIDFENLSPFFKQIIDTINTDSDTTKLSEKELVDALKNKPVAQTLSRLICKNPSEWWTDESMGHWERLFGLVDSATKAALEQIIKDVCWWDQVATNAAGFPLNPTVYHFHPVAFLEQMGRLNTDLITYEMLCAVCKDIDDVYFKKILPYLNKYALLYNVNTPLKIAHCLSQMGHESDLRVIEESLYYKTAEKMQNTYPAKKVDNTHKYPKLWDTPDDYLKNSKALANYVYADRMGNGNEESGDGYKYRGRGLIQLTGKNNYQNFTDDHNKRFPDDKRDFIDNPDLMIQNICYGIEASFWWWMDNKCNELCIDSTANSVNAVTKRVNGGLNGYDDRLKRFNNIIKFSKVNK